MKNECATWVPLFRTKSSFANGGSARLPQATPTELMKTKPIACFRLFLPSGHFLALLLVAALISPTLLAAPAQQAYLKASNTDSNDQFGFSVAVSGDTMVIGAYQEASSATGVNGDQSDNSATNSGAAYVFVRSGTNRTHQAYLN